MVFEDDGRIVLGKWQGKILKQAHIVIQRAPSSGKCCVIQPYTGEERAEQETFKERHRLKAEAAANERRREAAPALTRRCKRRPSRCRKRR